MYQISEPRVHKRPLAVNHRLHTHTHTHTNIAFLLFLINIGDIGYNCYKFFLLHMAWYWWTTKGDNGIK